MCLLIWCYHSDTRRKIRKKGDNMGLEKSNTNALAYAVEAPGAVVAACARVSSSWGLRSS